jgi:hypothetical protein
MMTDFVLQVSRAGLVPVPDWMVVEERTCTKHGFSTRYKHAAVLSFLL